MSSSDLNGSHAATTASHADAPLLDDVANGHEFGTVVDLASASEQRRRLEAELADFQARAAAARRQLADLDLRPALTLEVERSMAASDAMEREYEQRIERIRDEARIEVERILVDAGAAGHSDHTEASGQPDLPDNPQWAAPAGGSDV
jgi:hypothetical protein